GTSVAPASHAGGLPVVKLTCGALVTQSLKLKTDIGPCPDDGIIVAADDLTIDLGGHRLIGSGEDGSGVGTKALRKNVTIKNGTIQRFYTGVYLTGATDFVLKNLKIKKNTFRGIGLINVNDTTIQDSRINRNGSAGIGMQNAKGLQIVRNLVNRNGGSGIVNNLSETNYIAENTVTRNADFGIQVINSKGILVFRNVVNRNGEDGIRISEPTGQFVSENTAKENGFDKGVDDDHGLGISAALNTPGHSNVVAGNDDPSQCLPAYLCS
ncbi:MAG: right-handed parallel beta-helix repeat-containing protein, partial [Actinomycetota bacterium]